MIGNSGGLGGVFGIRYALNRPLPFPEGNPQKHPSLSFRIYRHIGRLIRQHRWKEDFAILSQYGYQFGFYHPEIF